jgi:hypothetical protein
MVKKDLFAEVTIELNSQRKGGVEEDKPSRSREEQVQALALGPERSLAWMEQSEQVDEWEQDWVEDRSGESVRQGYVCTGDSLWRV